MAKKLPEYVGKVVQNGHSFHLSIPAYMRRYLKLEKGDVMKVQLTLVERENLKNSGESPNHQTMRHFSNGLVESHFLSENIADNYPISANIYPNSEIKATI